MGDTTATDEDGVSPEPTVASILGIRGHLRFRPHGSTQKAHVVLRRVELSDDESEDGDTKQVVYFSLFAQKRIEVKPGKEILLAIAAPDGRFIETPVIFEGDLPGSTPPPPERIIAPPPPVEQPECPPLIKMPPKMRKTWARQVPANPAQQVLAPNTHPIGLVAPLRSSIGIQTQPEYVSTCVETVREVSPAQESCATQTERQHFSKDVQTETSVSTNVEERIATPNLQLSNMIGIDEESTPIVHHLETPPSPERSLSPMELDSPASSPPSSPLLQPMQLSATDESSKLLSFDSSSSSLQNPLLSKEMPLWPSLDEGRGLVVTPAPANTRDDPSTMPPGLTLPSYGTSHSVEVFSRNSMNTDRVMAHQAPTPFVPVAQLASSQRAASPHVTSSVVNSNAPDARPPLSKRATVANPFVSGGVLTDFVGLSSHQTPRGVARSELYKISNILVDPSATTNSSQPTTTSTSNPAIVSLSLSNISGISNNPANDDNLSTVSIIASSSVSSVSPPRQGLSNGRAHEQVSNASASSSKVKIEELESASAESPSISFPAYTPPLDHTPNSAESASKSHPVTNSHRPLRWSPSNDASGSRPKSPPASKSLAHISSISYNNPLGIKPACGRSWTPTSSTPVSVSPSSSVPRKPVKVGSRWPHTRQTPTKTIPTLPPPGTPSTPTTKTSTSASSTPKEGTVTMPSGEPTGPPTLASNDEARETIRDVTAGVYNSALVQTRDELPSSVVGLPPSPALNSVSPQPPKPNMYQNRNSSGDHFPSFLSDANRVLTQEQTFMSEPNRRVLHTTRPVPPIEATANVRRADSRDPVIRPPPLHTSVPVPTHPLPPKPVAFSGTIAAGSWSPRRGVKRMVSPGPPVIDAKRKRTFKWPTIDSAYTVRLKGDEDVGIRTICFNSDGSQFAVACHDRSVRIWNNKTRTEVAKLAHNMPVLDIAWMERDSGVVTLGDNGIVSTWTRNTQNKWLWAKILDASGERKDDEPCCLAFLRDRIAIAFPKIGVKVWLFTKGTWVPQRSILRQNVTTIKFVEDGDALIGGTTDGVLWYCQIPNGTLRAYAFLKAKVCALDINSPATHALVTQVGGRTHLVGIKQDDNKGKIVQVYANNDNEANASYDFGALFANRGQTVLFGAVKGCIMAWDKHTADVVYGLNHNEDWKIEIVKTFDNSQSADGLVLTGSRTGQLSWFVLSETEGFLCRKRVKLE